MHTKRIRAWALRPFSFLCRMHLQASDFNDPQSVENRHLLKCHKAYLPSASLEPWRPFFGARRVGTGTRVMPSQAARWPPVKARIEKMLAYAMVPLLRRRKTAVGPGWVLTWSQACVSSGHLLPPSRCLHTAVPPKSTRFMTLLTLH